MSQGSRWCTVSTIQRPSSRSARTAIAVSNINRKSASQTLDQDAIQDVPAQLQLKALPFGRILHGCLSGFESPCLVAHPLIIQLAATDVTYDGRCGGKDEAGNYSHASPTRERVGPRGAGGHAGRIWAAG
jgi:hypothetical protein